MGDGGEGMALETTQAPDKILESVILQGDISKLSPLERVQYYKSVCVSVGLNPLTQPLAYIQLSGKSVLYAKKDATDQLRKVHGVSVSSSRTERIDDVFLVVVQVSDANGRQDMGTGAVNIKGLQGDALANALMKAETKAKRRATLSICGLGLLDETELDTIPELKPVPPQAAILPDAYQEPDWTPSHGDEPLVDPLVDYPDDTHQLSVAVNDTAVKEWGAKIGNAPTWKDLCAVLYEGIRKDPRVDAVGHKTLDAQFAQRKAAMGWKSKAEQSPRSNRMEWF